MVHLFQNKNKFVAITILIALIASTISDCANIKDYRDEFVQLSQQNIAKSEVILSLESSF